MVEKRKPEYAPQPQYYDYEEEVIATTPKAVQPPRPKFQQPQYSAAPVPPRPQFANAIPSDVTYADAKPQYKPQSQPQYESYESRQPAQFPQQEAPVQQSFSSNRPADFPLFTPVNSRVDAFKPRPQKVRSVYKITKNKGKRPARHRRRRKKNAYIVVRKRRRYYF